MNIQPRKLNVRRTVIVASVLIALFVYTYLIREPPPPPHAEIRGRTMGTTYTVKLAGAGLGKTALKQIQADIDAYLAEINRQMSTYIPDSEISAFNRSTATNAVTISPAFAEVVPFALELSQASDGAFDPTVGPLIDLWGFGHTDRQGLEPELQALEKARASCGYRHLEMPAPDVLRKDLPELQISLAAVAKGYAVDGIARLLSDRTLTNFYVEIGGEVSVRGLGPDERPSWRIGIDYPDPSAVVGATFLAILDLTDCAVATSGDYRNFRSGKGGTRLSHLIDPRTGRPAAAPLASATIIAPTCMLADGLATAVSILGEAEGLRLIESYPGVEALLVIHEPDGSLRQVETDGFAAFRSSDH